MSSFLSTGTIPLRADEAATVIANEELGYPFEIPKVFLDGTVESYYPQVDFSWGEDTVVVLRDNCLTTYTKSSFAELLAEDENGNVIWMDGRSAPYEGCWPGKYLNKTRGAQVYTIVEYNLATAEKKTYKVVPEGTAPFDEQDIWSLSKFVDSETLGNTFEVKDGVLVGYNGVCDDVQIPDSVTSIGWRAFGSHNTYTRIRIPKTVVEIEPTVFRQLTIAHMEVDSDNPRYYCRDGLLIDKQTKAIICGYAGETIPNDGSVITIGSNAFYGRTDLKHMEIPELVTEIGDGAFSHCVNLEKVVMSDLITVIGRNAFAGCKSLTEINLPSSITKISSGMFSKCTKLKSVTLPDTITTIENYAFIKCSALEKIIIPDTVSEIGEYVFESCTALSEVKLPSFITCIPACLFSQCNLLCCITIPESVLQIGRSAFSSCSSLKEINLPDSVIDIKSSAFRDCTNLKKVRLPNEIITISEELFKNCKQLSDVVIPRTVAKIESKAFLGCSTLAEILLPPSVKIIEDAAFYDCTKLEQVDLPIHLISLGKRIFGRELFRHGDSTQCSLQPMEKHSYDDSYLFW